MVTTMFAYLRRIFRRQAPVPEVTVIDLQAYYDLLERRQKAWLADIKQRARDRERMSIIAWGWARDCVSHREQRELSGLLTKDIRAWLRGLKANEVMALARANDHLIRGHIYEGARIAGVRAVQPLPQATLHFPRPKRVGGGNAAAGRRPAVSDVDE
jgi:hypothetical protein